MGGIFKKIVEWGTECKYVPPGSRCGACNKKIAFFASGFWSKNSEFRHLSDGVLCGKCYEKTRKLIKEKNKWMSKEIKKLDEWKKFDNNLMTNYSADDIKKLFNQKELCDREILSLYGEGACGIFRIKDAFQIKPDIFNVGVARAKKLDKKIVVFGTADEGSFKKGDSIKLDNSGDMTETRVIEAFSFDKDTVNGRGIDVAFEETLRANLGYTKKVKENSDGWLILDTEYIPVKNGARIMKYTK